MRCFVFFIRDQDVGKVNRAARDVHGLQGDDKRLVETLDIVVVRRVTDGGEGCLRLSEEVLGDLRSIYVRVSTVVVSSQNQDRRERLGGSAVESAKAVQW